MGNRKLDYTCLTLLPLLSYLCLAFNNWRCSFCKCCMAWFPAISNLVWKENQVTGLLPNSCIDFTSKKHVLCTLRHIWFWKVFSYLSSMRDYDTFLWKNWPQRVKFVVEKLIHPIRRNVRTDNLKSLYSLRSILPFANMNVSSTKMCLDTSAFVKDNMGRRE
jgi:hypothetical protein